jgi:transcriptional regulator with XRE-family HTH domain
MRAITPDILPTAVLETCYTLGKLVMATRKARGLTQRALCESAGIGRTTLLEIEHGSPRVQFAYWLLALESLGLLENLTKNISAAHMGLIANAVTQARRPA